MTHAYILKSINYSKTYTGSTNNLERRVAEHNAGHGNFLKRYMPWKLVYSEQYDNLSEARAREKYLKSAGGQKFVKKINIPR